MKARLIYVKDRNYYVGKNQEAWEKTMVIEKDGKYYEIRDGEAFDLNWGSRSTGRTIKVVEFNPENIPEEYEEIGDVYQPHNQRWDIQLRHGNSREINIDLTRFGKNWQVDEIPDELKEEYRKEIKALKEEELTKQRQSYPYLDYYAVLENADLSEEEHQNALLIIAQIEKELTSDKYLKLSDYKPIIENLVPVAKGEAVIVTHKNASYSRPEDGLISLSDIKNGNMGFANSGQHWNHAWGVRDTKPRVFSLQGRTISLKDGTSYCGSYWSEGYSIDVMQDENGEPYIVRNVYESWNNSQYYHGTLNLNLPVDRFEISTGEEGSFKDYNEEVRQEKSAKKDFFKKTMNSAMEEFGISWKQAQILLKFAGTVSALADTVNLSKSNVTPDQLANLARKISYDGFNSVIRDNDKAVGGIDLKGNFDSLQNSVRTLQYIDYLLEEHPNSRNARLEASGNKKTKIPKPIHSSATIADMLENVKAGEIKSTLEQLVEMGEPDKAQEDGKLPTDND